MNSSYIIPANSKKSALILGLFTGVDLIIFAIGCTVTIVMLMLARDANLVQMILIASPALISAFLVAPVPHYHNVLQLITNIILFFFNRRRYYWRGWCVSSGKDE